MEDLYVKNLVTLANGLMDINNHPQGVAFDMGLYKGKDRNASSVECGSVGCAVGWAPFFGIEKSPLEGWGSFSMRTLIPKNAMPGSTNPRWVWCFSAYWANVDNTPKGAAQRIIYMLQYGLPDNWREQLGGDAPVSYKHITGFCEDWLAENVK